MAYYIGIDLGTTNSAICSYDGSEVRLYKSAEQNDVTPSAIFIDRRGNKFVGKRAYDQAARNPENAVTKFKRLMGTKTPFTFKQSGVTMLPEECSAEVLKLCFGYLPEEIRTQGVDGTVITVPAAFNQLQKEATLKAAEMAGLGKVALMQEPVAAVMCIVKRIKRDGTFLVFDFGGGTLDIAIAESISGHVSLLAHGGIQMCGGTDFDRAILDNIVKSWLFEHFDLPEDLTVNRKYKQLLRMSLWAAEKAKIELSAKEEATISLNETELGVEDESGEEIYLDITLTRADLDRLMKPKVDDAIEACRETLSKAGISASDVEQIVFIGGPTQYRPLRDRVSFELGIAPSTDVNPMTAVSEGASVFAESIDWSTKDRGRKSSRGSLDAGADISVTFNYQARTVSTRAKIIAMTGGDVPAGCEFQIDSLDTGWTSGRQPLEKGNAVTVTLAAAGVNRFKAFVFLADGSPVSLKNSIIEISRTAASIDAIPASHSVGIEAREKIGGELVLDFLVKEGDQLPKKGRKVFKSEEPLEAGSASSLKFKLWEGEIETPITDNRFIGLFEIKGSDLEEGSIPAGADLICDYEVLDSGNIVMEVSVPAVGGAFKSGHNFYSAQEGQLDLTREGQRVNDEIEDTTSRIDELEGQVDDERLDAARAKIEQAEGLDVERDPEAAQQAMENVQEARKLLAQTRREHLEKIRRNDLERETGLFEHVKKYAKPSEVSTYENKARTAGRLISRANQDFETTLSDMAGQRIRILWRQDWFVVGIFKDIAEHRYRYQDSPEVDRLLATGERLIASNRIEDLRKVVYSLWQYSAGAGSGNDMIAAANIIRS